MFRRLLTVFIITGILLFGTSAGAVSPPDRDPDFVRPFMECSGNTGVYLRIWDTNPQTKAGFFSLGEYEVRGSEPIFHNPIIYTITDDVGQSKYYRVDNGQEIPETELIDMSPCEALVKYKPVSA